MKSPPYVYLTWFCAAFLVGFIGFRIAGERYRIESVGENGVMLRDSWTGKLYKPAKSYRSENIVWREHQ